jgi:uncharacterized membrane protein
MTSFGVAHLSAAVAALAFGGVVLLARKGTESHRVMGAGYVAAMLATNLTALGVYHLTGAFGPFHALALVSLAIIARGMAAVWRRRAGWLKTHYYSMAWSYVGLLAAASAEVAVRIPLGLIHSRRDGMMVGLVGVALFLVIGFVTIPRLERRALAYRGD